MQEVKKQEIRIFIGSSGNENAKLIAQDVERALKAVNKQINNYKISPRLWCSDGIYKNGEFTLQSLVNELENDDAGVFIYYGDDCLMNNNKSIITKANVIFEHGLFVGRLGKEKTFVLLCGGKKEDCMDIRKEQTPVLKDILSDYDGVIVSDYATFNYDTNNLINKLKEWLEDSVVCKKIQNHYIISASIVESHSPNDNRNSEFQKLYQEAKEGDTIKVLGLGVTSFLNGEIIDDLLEKQVNVTILLMDEKIIKNENDCEFEKLIKKLSSMDLNETDKSCPVTIRNVLIDKNHFSDYQHRCKNTVYLDKMRQAYDNCKRYKLAYPKLFKFFYFNSFIPMSITAFQKKGENKSGKLIVEFIIPFTNNRILLKVLEEKNKTIYDTFMSFYDTLEERSRKSEKTEAFNKRNNINKTNYGKH